MNNLNFDIIKFTKSLPNEIKSFVRLKKFSNKEIGINKLKINGFRLIDETSNYSILFNPNESYKTHIVLNDGYCIAFNGDAKDIIMYIDNLSEAEYKGKEVKLNKPSRGDVKKYKVFVKDPQTKNVKKVNFGDPNMEIKRDDPQRRKSFRARHKCDTAKDKTSPRYWSCKFWSSKNVSDLVKEELDNIVNSFDQEDLNEILKHYLIAALWTEEERLKDESESNQYNDDDDDYDEEDSDLDRLIKVQSNLNKKNFTSFTREDIEIDSLIKAYMDIKKFIELAGEEAMKDAVESIGLDKIGHNIWLSRNGHGAGFFDDYYGSDETENKLTKAAQSLREVDLYVNDSGKLSFSNE
jgi:hypothetical protein